MKAFKILIASVFLSAFTLTSCSNDDDNVQVPTSIVGKWNFSLDVTQTNVGTSVGPEVIVEYADDVQGCNRNYLEFTSAMTVKKSVFFKNAQGNCEESSNNGTYTKSSDVLNINLPGDNNYNGTFTITKLNSTQLSLERKIVDGDVTVIRTRLLTKAVN